MFSMSLEEMIQHAVSKTVDNISVMSSLNYLVPNPDFGYSPNSPIAEITTQEMYEDLVWRDDRPMPTWAEIEAAKADVLLIEKGIDYEDIRRLRQSTSTIEFDGNLYFANPIDVSLLSELISHAEEVGGEVTFLNDIKTPVAMSLIKAKQLRTLLRTKLQLWIVDPISE